MSKRTNLKTTFTVNSTLFIRFGFLLGIFLSASFLQAQETDDPNIEKVQSIVSYYKFMLNTIGKSSTPSNEKEIIVSTSYEKVFRDPEVQIEDDLSLERSAIVNKNVQAYLRDVDFFFQDISFDFEDITIAKEKTETGDDFYLVSFISSWEGRSLEGQQLTNSVDRFMEVNMTPAGDIEIVSIYSTKVSREEELRDWWYELPVSWDNFFREQYGLGYDSVSYQQLENLVTKDSISIANQQWIDDITPLGMFRALRYANLSGTGISQFVALRYAQNLEHLIIDQTRVSDIGALEYFKKLRRLSAKNTPVRNLLSLQTAEGLQHLDLSGIEVISFEPLQVLSGLKVLNLSSTAFTKTENLASLEGLEVLNLDKTYVMNLSGLSKLTELRELNISNTYVSDLSKLSGLESLVTLNVEHTEVKVIDELGSLPSLERVYADYTNIGEADAGRFMQAHPDVLVITNTTGVLQWWNSLPIDWKNALLQNADKARLSTEEVIQLLQKDSLDISAFRLLDGKPLTKFARLRYVNLSDNLFTEFSFLREFSELETLIGNGLPIDDLQPLTNLNKLKYLELKKALVSDITPLLKLSMLKYVDLEDTKVQDEEAKRLWKSSDDILVMYRSERLKSWWKALDPAWSAYFSDRYGRNPNTRTLHQIGQLKTLKVEERSIKQVDDLVMLIGLEELKLVGTQVTNLLPLEELYELRVLECSNGPLFDLSTVSGLFRLEALLISNTPVDDLDPITALKNLEKLDASGTQIKNIKELRGLKELVYLDVSNTRVWQLHWLFDHPKFEELICYNSRVRQNKLDEFKSIFPNCKVTYY